MLASTTVLELCVNLVQTANLMHLPSFSLLLSRPGVRVFYITRNWELRSRLLSVRQFNPVPEILKNNRLSDLLKGYLETVLEEFHLTFSNIFSATSDSGSDVQRLCNVLLPGLWEWCICHMIDCALVEVRLGKCEIPAHEHR